jgi:hypothetical protein
MVIEKVNPGGKISGYFASQGEMRKVEEFKAEKKGNSIYLIFKSTGSIEFTGQLVNQDRITGPYYFRSARGRPLHETLTFTRKK